MGLFSKGTRVEIVALTVKGRKALSIQKEDEDVFRAKYKTTARRDIPKKHRAYLKTVSAFLVSETDSLPSKHVIMGFKKMPLEARHNLYMGVKKTFFDNGCTLDDFKVVFLDE